MRLLILYLTFIHLFHYRQKYGTSVKHNEHTWIGILICWKWLGINQNNYYGFNATLTCGVMDENATCNVRYQKYMSPGMYHCLILRLKFHISIFVSLLYGNCMFLIIRYWHHAKFATGALDQNGRKAWIEVSYLVISYPIENLLQYPIRRVNRQTIKSEAERLNAEKLTSLWNMAGSLADAYQLTKLTKICKFGSRRFCGIETLPHPTPRLIGENAYVLERSLGSFLLTWLTFNPSMEN